MDVERDETPMPSDLRRQLSDEIQDSPGDKSSWTRSASDCGASFPDNRNVGHTSPLRSERRITSVQMSVPLDEATQGRFRRTSDDTKRNSSLEKQGGSHYPYTSPWQHNETLNRSSEGRIFPLASQTAPPMVTPVSVVPPPNCPVVGSTDLRYSPNISTGPCQLTIFYNGSVCVYDNVSPEKAQAIMLLAGNGDSVNSSAALPPAPKLQPAAPTQTPPNQPPIANPSLSFSSSISLAPPLSVTSLAAVASSCATQVNPVRPILVPAAHIKPSEAPKSSPFGAARPSFIPSAVPQARKASLARFLEKRKERVVGASPYAVSKNTSECSAAGPEGSTLGTNSVRSSPLRAGK